MPTKATFEDNPETFGRFQDLEVTGRIIGPQFSRLFASIEKLVANNQRNGIQIVGSSTYDGIAQWTCDGVSDQVQINAAIVAVNAAGGGTVWLTEGVYVVNASIVLLSGVTLIGSGWGSTIIQPLANSLTLITVTGTAGTYNVVGATLCDLCLDGNGKTSISGVIATDTTDFTVLAVKFEDVTGNYGIYNYDTKNVTVSDCKFLNPPAYPVLIGTSAGTDRAIGGVVSRCLITGARSASGFSGIQVQKARGVTVLDCRIIDLYVDGAASGIAISGSGCKISRCVVNNKVAGLSGDTVAATTGISSSADDSILEHNEVEGVTSYSRDSGNYYGILNTGERVTIHGNVVRNNISLMLNGNCESATPPRLVGEAAYSVANCTGARSAAPPTPPHGTYSLLITKTSAGGAGDADFIFHDHATTTTTDMAGLMPGTSYRIRTKFYCPAAVLTSNARFRFGYYSGGAWTDSDFNPTLQDEFQEVDLTVAIPAAATGIRMYASILSAEATNDTIRLDDIEIVPQGVHNEHSRNYANTGTETQENNNSWQNPFPT